MDDFLEDLNEPQRDAVLHQQGPLLVLAGAGSGKTRVITRRIASLVRDRKVPAWRILAVTFTNKAAREMRERLDHILGPLAQGLTVSTFHSASALILRREAENVGLERNFVIYDDGDQLQVVLRAIREAGIDVASVTPREILSKIDAEKNQGRLPDQMEPGQDPKQQAVQRVYRKYQNYLRSANAVDFGDLLLLLVELFRSNEEVRKRYSGRFQHVLVDEFQDTNPVQYALLKALAPPGPTANLVVVGDDDQSIYRWRGAEVDNILGFPTEYPGCKVVKLEQNYRSDQTILEAAHAVISRNKRRMDKKLWSSRAKGESLGLIVARDERGEAQEVAAKIHELRRDGVTDYDQMAVFFRANAQSRVLEETFRLMRVPYVLVSGRSFYERAEVKDAASYLRLMANPRSDADLERVINVPARGIGDTTVERMREYAAEKGISLYEALEVPERIDSLGGAAVKRLKAFRELAERLVTFARHTPDATSAARYMLEQTGLVATYMAEGTDEAMGRAENLKELLTATGEFDRQREERLAASGQPLPTVVPLPEGPEMPGTPEPEPEVQPSPQGDLFAAFHRPPPPPPLPLPPPAPIEVAPPPPPLAEDAPLELEVPPLQGFLEQLSLVGDADGETGVGKQRVSLMTMHAAKGLEFDAVFITGMEEEVFPNRRATKPEATEEEMSEERRLCYVGFTRARRRLFCSLAQCRALFGELKFNAPSRFLAEVPQELFGFHQVPEIERPSHRPPMIRRRGEGDDGVQVDRTYDQSTDFHQGGEDTEVKGMRVSHTQFGRGQVLEVVGKGPNAKLTIRFDNFGVKTVIARFLQPA
ncbi:MAG: UvrD-helicase domain-containing protein [Archangium sp.]|nr:UvrD-helicase domain-containing protein [Archangium sp.]MDP3571477.1 UvrD-helicase domain-containing protein [Archangium sp.]